MPGDGRSADETLQQLSGVRRVATGATFQVNPEGSTLNALFILVIISSLDGGGWSSAFVTTDTAVQCEARGKAIRSILDDANVETKEFVCLSSQQSFERFLHGQPANAPKFYYRVTLTRDAATIDESRSVDACKTSKSLPTAAGARVYCTTSTQRMVVPAQ